MGAGEAYYLKEQAKYGLFVLLCTYLLLFY